MKLSQQIIPTIMMGIVVGIVEILLIISFATLIFSGDLAPFASSGITVFIIASIITITITALFSSMVGMFSGLQDVTGVLMALMTGHVILETDAAGMQGETAYYSIMALIAINSLVVGIMFFIIIRFKLSGIIRSIPYPVIGGLVAGTGYLLIIGGLEILTDNASYGTFLQQDILIKWAPGVIFGVILFILLRQINHYLTMPIVLISGIVIFYGVFFLSDMDIASAQADGLLLGPFPESSSFQPLTPMHYDQISWEILFPELIHLPAVIIVSAVTLFLNISALELSFDENLDTERELKIAGTVNSLLGLFGGIISFHSLSDTAMARRVGIKNRFYPLVAAMFISSVLFIGTDALVYFPIPILGGLLIFIGLAFLDEWLFSLYRQMPRLDFGIIIMTVVAIAVIGYLEGVFVGLTLAVLDFTFNYSREEIVRHRFSGTEYHSSMQRSSQHREHLKQNGHFIRIYKLQGFIFFGTSNRLFEQIAVDIDALQIVILDFRKVTAIDLSATYSLKKLNRLCEQHQIELIFTAIPPDLSLRLKDILPQSYDQLDKALVYAEEQILNDLITSTDDDKSEEYLTIFSQDIMRKLQHYMLEKSYGMGETVVQQNALSDEMFFVKSGRLGVYLGLKSAPALRIRTLTRGSMVGEISTYLDTPRSASIIAEEDSTLMILTQAALDRIAAEDIELAFHFHHRMATVLASRLADTTTTLRIALD